MTLNKFHQLRSKVVPALVKRTSKTLGLDMSKDERLLLEVVDNMDQMVFNDYINRRSGTITSVVEGGVLGESIDWLEAEKPTGEWTESGWRQLLIAEVRPYMHRTLLLLVETHAKVNDVAPPLVGRVMESLIEMITQVALSAFQKVPNFGTGGMLTATLEIEFFHQSVGAYITPKANDTLSQIYDTISAAYKRQQSSDDFERELDSLRKLLSDSRKATVMETLCFRAPARERS